VIRTRRHASTVPTPAMISCQYASSTKGGRRRGRTRRATGWIRVQHSASTGAALAMGPSGIAQSATCRP